MTTLPSTLPVPVHSDVREIRRDLEGPPSRAFDRLSPTDEGLLDSIEKALRASGGADRLLDAPAIAGCLGIRSVDLAGRVAAGLGAGSSGWVRADVIVAGVKRLLYGGPSERRKLAFRIHDLDGDGLIDRAELRRMIALSLAEDDVTAREGTADRLAGHLLLTADRSRDGKLSFDEFDEALGRCPDLAASIDKSGVRWVAVSEDAADRLDPGLRASWTSRLRRLLENRASYLTFVALWMVANVALFEHAWRSYATCNAFVQLARGCGACLNLNGALILLPMMRRALTAVRKTFLRRMVPLDDAVGLHVAAGHAMFAFALVHTGAHLANFALMRGRGAASPMPSAAAALTGIAWLVVFGVMWFFAFAPERARHKFEVFHKTHALYGLWFILGVSHGPVFWKWVLVPVSTFAVGWLVGLTRRDETTEILQTRALRSGVTRIDLRKPEGFDHRPGDFAFLRIPQVTEHEWHPFTISSAPEREMLTFHVRAMGDWTRALRQLAETRQLGESSEPLMASIDGPYGAPCTAVFDSRRAVLIAGGIGVTPFASVLESIVMRAKEEGRLALERVDFVWLNHDQYSFEWFVDLLSSVEDLDTRRLVRMHIYMTGGRSDAASAIFDLARREALLAGEKDVVTGLRIETHMGAPDWRALLAEIALDAAGVPVDVYFCGPPGLASKVAPLCVEAGMTFRQERF